MKISGEVDGKYMSDWLIESARAMDVGLGEVLREEISFVGDNVLKLTPPVASPMSLKQSWATQKKVGQAAVRRDIGRVYSTVNSYARQIAEKDADAAKGFRSAARKGESSEAWRILRSVGLGRLADQAGIGSFDKSLHKSRRKRGTGRVGKRGERMVVTDQAELNRYIREQLAKVGSLKRGWVLAGSRLVRKPKAAAWITKATGGHGSLMDKSRKKIDPTIALINSTDYGGRQNSAIRFTSMAIRGRVAPLAKKTKRMAARRWKK